MIYTKKFNSTISRNLFAKKLHKNRINKVYEYKEILTNKIIYVIKYYRNTKKLRAQYNFDDCSIF